MIQAAMLGRMFKRLSEIDFRCVLFVVFVALLFFAWANRFIQDDAFISFRYARNLAEGNGLVWNCGERLEGYTNFLWTLAMAIPHYLKHDPVAFSFFMGMAFFALTLAFTYKLAVSLLESHWLGILTLVLLGTNYSFSCYATGGLETQMQTAFFVIAAYLVVGSMKQGSFNVGRTLFLSLISALAVLTRPDSALPMAVWLGVSGYLILREKSNRKAALLFALIGPIVVIIGAWVFWKIGYYGEVLPNTFYAKASSITSPIRGLKYVYAFFSSYWLFVFPLLVIAAVKSMNSRLAVLAVGTLVWLAYVVKVGGDFMEFRFIVPVMPFIFVLIVWVSCVFIKNKAVQVALVALVLFGSLQYMTVGRTFYQTGLNENGISTIPEQYEYVIGKDGQPGWIEMGLALREAFPKGSKVLIGVTPAGAIPYYSELQSLDMLGINDRWVARYGTVIGDYPGHQRLATVDYMLKRRVNLVINHPLLIGPGETAREYIPHFFRRILHGGETLKSIPAGSRMLEIPLHGGYRLLVLYLVPSREVDDAIARHGWPVWRF